MQAHTSNHTSGIRYQSPGTIHVDLNRDRRRRQRHATDEDVVRRFTPGRIPTVIRTLGSERFARLVDILGACTGLLLFAPALLLAILAIRLTSPGPTFYAQIRVGIGGRLFKMYKLRTMVTGADRQQSQLQKYNEISGPAFKMRHDPRITPVGRVLRKFSIDEVPQFLNVLRGDMSLVGPRPPLPREVKKYQRWHLQRLMVKPGLTGLWQVSGRNRLNFDEWVRLDIRYIRQRSLWLDLKIMLKTFKVVFIRPDGA
jgi:lipopolysaccharide/colanic/teichoic acid biosynthesis glycosyltransferase